MKSRNWIALLLAPALYILTGCSQGSAGDTEIPLIRGGGDYAETLQEAEKLAQNPIAKADKGQALTEEDREKLKKAAALFEGLVAYQPAKTDARFAVGRIYEALGQTEKATTHYREATRLNPKPEEEMLGDAQKIAKEALEKADRGDPLTAKDLENLRKAEKITAAKIKKKAKDPDLRYTSARIHEALGNKEQAVEEYRTSLRLRGKPEDQIVSEAMQAAEAILGKYDKEKKLDQIDKAALQRLAVIFDAIIAYKPTEATYHYTAGNVFKLAGRKDKAIVSYGRFAKLKGLKLSEEDFFKVAAAHYWSALLSMELEDYETAAKEAEVAAVMYPSSEIILVAAAKAYAGLKQYERADAFLEAILAINPKNKDALALQDRINSAKTRA